MHKEASKRISGLRGNKTMTGMSSLPYLKISGSSNHGCHPSVPTNRVYNVARSHSTSSRFYIV